MNVNFTKISNDIIKGDNELNSKELSVMSIILMTRNSKDVCIFSLKMLYDMFNISSGNSYSQKEIKNILQIFSDEEILFYHNSLFLENESSISIDNFNKNDLIFAQLCDVVTDNFTIIKDEDIKNIIKYGKENNIDTYSLLQSYIYICSCINNNELDENYLLCFPSIINICEMVRISEKTILKYIDIFRELNVFICDYAGYKILADGRVKNGCMYYTRPENEELLLCKLRRERQEKGYYKISKRIKDKSNLKRSLKQKINILNNKGIKNLVEREEIKLLEEQYNKLNNECNEL